MSASEAARGFSLGNGQDAASKGARSPFRRMSSRRTSSRGSELPESSPAQLDTRRGQAMQSSMRSPFESAPPPRSDDDDDEDPAELLQMLRIKDLDNDKEYNVDQRFMIRDLNTGQFYMIADEAGGGQGTSQTSGKITDIIGGRELSMDEFQRNLGLQTLGLNPLGERVKARKADGSDSDSELEAAAHNADSGPQPKQRKGSGPDLEPSASAEPKQKQSWLARNLFKGGKGKGEKVDSDDDMRSVSSFSTASLGRDSVASNADASRRLEGEASGSGRPGVPVKVQVHKKLVKELAELYLVQEIHAHQGVVWIMKFSRNGRYLATAGQDMIVRVWEVVLNRGEMNPSGSVQSEGYIPPDQESGTPRSQAGADAGCPVLKPQPHRTYRGHRQDVLDICWSRSQFLLSASMDKTVRLWHISMDDCLRVFRHTDFVTALDFHPVDDKYFLSGSIDGKVRCWNIPDQKVVDWADVHEMVTAAAFSSEGSRAVVGTMRGKCRFYQVDTNFRLDYQAQIDVKNRRGKQAKGRKVTGVQFDPQDSSNLLVTSNDSRIRLYEGYTLKRKFKGHQNRTTQIRASMGVSADFLICGSDDGWVYVWDIAGADKVKDAASKQQDKSASYEAFHAHDEIVTVAVFAPDTARRHFANALDSSVSSGHASAYGQVMVSAGYGGVIKVFENVGTAAPLK
ncbi:hypothetical protein WJX84_008956 [Apatococcus fuscideae]|uniref:WD repeat-containing protein 44 n=1 Tax=Apatococcus fuscideae TaxID=2026836 RepID=A0AAW1SQ03_9CHLO